MMNRIVRLALVAVALLYAVAALHAADRPLSDFRRLVRTDTWTEQWPDAAGRMQSRSVTAEELPIDCAVRVIEQRLNPDYPKSTPRGGTGRGIWIR